MDSRFCERCKKTMREDQFYKSNNLEKYPKSFMNICKKCMTAHIQFDRPDTYLPILEDIDVPYVQDEWAKVVRKLIDSGKDFSGLSVLGRYLAKMRLNQYYGYRWKDTEMLRERARAETQSIMQQQGYDQAAIDEVLRTGTMQVPENPLREPASASAEPDAPQEDYFANEADFTPDLTEEDKTYLLLKWGKSYRPDEWVRLEQLYEEMIQSYDVQTAGHIDTLKLVCKTSLKANQLLDIGD